MSIVEEAKIKRVAFLLDTRGRVTLNKNVQNYTLFVYIFGLTKGMADSIVLFQGDGYSIPEKRSSKFCYCIAAEKAVIFLNRLAPYSKWHKRQIKIANKYSKLMAHNSAMTSAMGRSAIETDSAYYHVVAMNKANAKTKAHQIIFAKNNGRESSRAA